MSSKILRRIIGLSVDFLALIAALIDPFSLYFVLLIYLGDLVGETIRKICQIVFAAPRENHSPTDPPAISLRGDTSPFRFWIPKLGTIQPINQLPAITLHNLKAGVAGLVGIALLAPVLGLVMVFLNPPFSIWTWPPNKILTAGSLTIIGKHGWMFHQFVNSDRPSAQVIFRDLRWFQIGLMVIPIAAVDAIYTGADFDPSLLFSTIALLLVICRIGYKIHQTSFQTPQQNTSSNQLEPFELSEPKRTSNKQFQSDKKAIWIAGMLDGIIPGMEWDLGWIVFRLIAFFSLVTAGFVLSHLSGLTVAIIGFGVGSILVVLTFVILGLIHFELAFGAMEYRLYDDVLVAYDTRLNTVQWNAPLDAIKDVSVERGFWKSVPGVDAAIITVNRTDLTTNQTPYGFYRQSLVYVKTPEYVADQLQYENTV